MSGNSFAARVEMLRDSWLERRQLRNLASAHDFESQLGLLQTMYGWAQRSAADIKGIYGDSLDISLLPEPGTATNFHAFSLTLAQSYTVTFGLGERRRSGSSRWFISATVTTGRGGAIVAAGPERRTGQWTRARLEDILLSVLGAYERSTAEDVGLADGWRLSGA